jgi:hypothetical protein
MTAYYEPPKAQNCDPKGCGKCGPILTAFGGFVVSTLKELGCPLEKKVEMLALTSSALVYSEYKDAEQAILILNNAHYKTIAEIRTLFARDVKAAESAMNKVKDIQNGVK